MERLVSGLERPISRERLDAYRQPDGEPIDMLVNYFWNIELSESFYPVLQACEVALRNSVHATLSEHFDTPYWFDSPDLLDWQRETVREARDLLRSQQKSTEPGRIVAELSFGFWSSMFNRPYEDPLWHANGAKLLDLVFPELPRTMRNRKRMSRRIERIRRLRNRVFHYEPIWNRSDLSLRHKQIVETLAWISSEMAASIAITDRFEHVHNGRAELRERIERLVL